MLHLNRIFNDLKDIVTGQSATTVSNVETGRVPALNVDSVNSKTVILHIYSISDRVNRFSLTIGLGLYHTAVEVYGKEHSFVGHPFPFSGIVSIIPKTAAYIYQEGLPMGQTKMTEQEVGNCLKELGQVFLGSSYHLLHRNCNHFANEFVKRLCNGKPPAYINRAANSSCCLPFLDHMFSAKRDAERVFIEVLYLTLNGDINSVIDVLDVNRQTSLSRYVSYIEASFDDHSIPKCLPSSSADYSTDIHYDLNQLQQRLIEAIVRPISEHISDSQEMTNEF